MGVAWCIFMYCLSFILWEKYKKCTKPITLILIHSQIFQLDQFGHKYSYLDINSVHPVNLGWKLLTWIPVILRDIAGTDADIFFFSLFLLLFFFFPFLLFFFSPSLRQLPTSMTADGGRRPLVRVRAVTHLLASSDGETASRPSPASDED